MSSSKWWAKGKKSTGREGVKQISCLAWRGAWPGQGEEELNSIMSQVCVVAHWGFSCARTHTHRTLIAASTRTCSLSLSPRFSLSLSHSVYCCLYRFNALIAFDWLKPAADPLKGVELRWQKPQLKTVASGVAMWCTVKRVGRGRRVRGDCTT